ncbi:MAG: flagellar hook-length control protein FliK, partial [Gammaproteobacteria bacterium]
QQSNLILNELLRNIESSLSKIQYNQLQHFISDDSLKSNWFIDLPIRHDDGSDIIHFRFSKNNNSDCDANDDKWSVTLSFSLEKLGDISIQLYLQNNKIGATVWASTNDTYNLFNQYLPDLQLQMENSGINVSNLRCNKGEIIHSENEKSTNILDEKV